MTIQALKEAAEKATAGEWFVTSDAGNEANRRVTSRSRPHIAKVYGTEPSDDGAILNARYIALANPSAILSLIASHQALAEALREVKRRSSLLMHQNIGRWDMRVEHDKRSSDVTATNIEIIAEALSTLTKE